MRRGIYKSVILTRKSCVLRTWELSMRCTREIPCFLFNTLDLMKGGWVHRIRRLGELERLVNTQWWRWEDLTLDFREQESFLLRERSSISLIGQLSIDFFKKMWIGVRRIVSGGIGMKGAD